MQKSDMTIELPDCLTGTTKTLPSGTADALFEWLQEIVLNDCPSSICVLLPTALDCALFSRRLARSSKPIGGIYLFSPETFRRQMAQRLGITYRPLAFYLVKILGRLFSLPPALIEELFTVPTSALKKIQHDFTVSRHWEEIDKLRRIFRQKNYLPNSEIDILIADKAQLEFDIFASGGFLSNSLLDLALLRAGEFASHSSFHILLNPDKPRNKGKERSIEKSIYCCEKVYQALEIAAKIIRNTTENGEEENDVGILLEDNETPFSSLLQQALQPLNSEQTTLPIEEVIRNGLFDSWIAFQNHPMRREAVELLQEMLHQDKIIEETYLDWRTQIIQLCRKNFSDRCDSLTLTKDRNGFLEILPLSAPPEEFWTKIQNLFPALDALKDKIQPIIEIFSQLPRKIFLETVVDLGRDFLRNDFQAHKTPEKIHWITLETALRENFAHLIVPPLQQTTGEKQEKIFISTFLHQVDAICHRRNTKTLPSKQRIPGTDLTYDPLSPRLETCLSLLSYNISYIHLSTNNELMANESLTGLTQELIQSGFNEYIIVNNEENSNSCSKIFSNTSNQTLHPFFQADELKSIHKIRRNPEEKFTIYDMSANQEGETDNHIKIFIPCKTFELYFSSPENFIWIPIVLKIKTKDIGSILQESHMVVGTEIHRSMENFAGELVKNFLKNEKKQKSIKEAPVFISCWRDAIFNKIESYSKNLSEKIKREIYIDKINELSTEKGIKSELHFGDKLELSLKGKIDLLVRDPDLHIFDYKTRPNRDPLKKESWTWKTMTKGHYLQLGLYCLFFRRNFDKVEAIIMRPFSRKTSLELTEIKKLDQLWKTLAEIETKVKIGYGQQRQNQSKKMSFVAYSYLRIPEEILAERLQKTYPALQ